MTPSLARMVLGRAQSHSSSQVVLRPAVLALRDDPARAQA